MTKKEAIKKLVDFALIDKTTENKFVSLGIVTPTQAALLKAKTGFSLEGYERIVDKSAINHVLKVHGNEKKEALKGQIAVVEKDFENLPDIVKSQNVIFSGKNIYPFHYRKCNKMYGLLVSYFVPTITHKTNVNIFIGLLKTSFFRVESETLFPLLNP